MKRYFSPELGLTAHMQGDCTAAFEAAFDRLPDNSELVLEPGVYRFDAGSARRAQYSLSNSDAVGCHRVSIWLRRRKGIVLNGCGAEILFHGQTMPIALDGCRDITLKNLVIDWDIPHTSEGEIIAVHDDFIDLKINKQLYPFHVEDGKLIFDGGDWQEPLWRGSHTEFDARTGKVAYGRGDTFPNTVQQQVSEEVVRFYGDFAAHRPQQGNIVVLRHGRREHPGILIQDSTDIAVENLTMHASGGLGILAQFSENLRFWRVKMLPNRAKGRCFASGHDDGIHLSADSGTVRVEECSFLGLMDDPVNLHGIAAKLERRLDAHTVMGRFMHPQSKGFARWALPGHTVALLDAQEMSEAAQGTVKRYELCTPETFRLEFEAPLPQAAFTAGSLENLTRTAALICRNNWFGSCRARGLLFCTPKPALVENNIFESAGAAILIAGDACTWYESGRCQDVKIRGNYFADCCLTSAYGGGEGIVSIHPELPCPHVGAVCHRGIRIEHNTFETSDARVLYALCTAGLRFYGNRIVRSYTYPGRWPKKKLVTLEHCSDTEIDDNLLIGDVVGTG
ncbi:hypothetical protein [Allofournierella sp.]|uniref:alpha-1,3-galactosidase-related protein n=1 Tax=Allofournierella sp. TaxID=1940256 RepID=UPI003AB80B8C